MDHTESVKQQFGTVAEAYVSSPIHARGSDLAKLLEVLQLKGDERVLDLATGVGHAAIAMAPRVTHVIGLDLTPEMLEHARRLAEERGLENVEFQEGSAERIPLPDASFDVVTCRIAAHHFVEPERAFAEVSRVLVPGGRFVLIDNYAPDSDELDQFINTLDKLRDPTHVRAYRLSEWQRFFERHGMRYELADLWETPHDFEYWVSQSRTPKQTVVQLRGMLVSAPKAVCQAFSIKTTPDLEFNHPKAMMVGTRG
jgi:ubiquinone/menaquinone biosynthesis C-methylase UbiE